MIPHKDGEHNNLATCYNKKHKRIIFVVENAYSILEKTFLKLLRFLKLHIPFVCDLFICCYKFHKVLISCQKFDVD